MNFGRLNTTDPVNWNHPLNKGRLAWWYQPVDSGWSPAAQDFSVTAGLYLRDLCRRFDGTVTNGASFTPTNSTFPNGQPCLMWSAGGGTDGQVNVGGATEFNFTDNFTVGCTFITDTLTPTGTGGLAGLLNKYNSPGGNEWSFRQHDGTLEFGGSTLIASGSILATNTVYRAVAVMQAGTATIYLNGLSVATGTPSISSGSDVVYIGESYEPGGANFRGRIGDAFISSRPWSTGEVDLDFKLSAINYQVSNGPLRLIPKVWVRGFEPFVEAPLTFTTSVGAGQNLYFANVAEFTTTLRPTVAASGIGPLSPDGPAEFVTEVGADQQFVAGQPTLVNFNTTVGVGNTVAGGAPVEFETTVGVDQSIRSIPGGDRRRLADRGYRR